jgi:hypothetical protein
VERDDDIEHEERGIYLIMLVASLPIVIALFAEGRDFDGGNTLMLILVVLGVGGLAAGLRKLRASRVPRARVVRDR